MTATTLKKYIKRRKSLKMQHEQPKKYVKHKELCTAKKRRKIKMKTNNDEKYLYFFHVQNEKFREKNNPKVVFLFKLKFQEDNFSIFLLFFRNINDFTKIMQKI